MEETVRIILYGYDFDRLQFRVTMPSKIPLNELKETEVCEIAAAQLINEHEIYPRKLRIQCWFGKTKTPQWSYRWIELDYGSAKINEQADSLEGVGCA